jgi:hypothetical protein
LYNYQRQESFFTLTSEIIQLFSLLLQQMPTVMQFAIIAQLLVALQFSISTASPLDSRSTPFAPAVRQLCQFPNLNGIENIAVCPNGRLLFSTFETGNLYGLDPAPTAAGVSRPVVVAQLTGSTGVTGIVNLGLSTYVFT